MKISKWLIGGIVSAQLLCSCSTVRISEYSNYKDSQFVFGPDKNAVLIVNDNVLVSEFIKTFNKKYSQKKDFIQQYADSCIVGLKKGGVFGDIKYGKSFKFISTDFMTANQEQQQIQVDSLFTNTTANYMIKVDALEVTNSVKGGPGIMMPMAGGGMGMMGGGQSESCIVNSHFQIYEIKTRKKVLDFISEGSGSVVFFAFESALKGAIHNSIENSVTYLKTGNVKF